MDALNQPGVPIEVIAKGRGLGSVLTSYIKFYEKAQESVSKDGRTPDEVFSDALLGSIYRLYLLGVEDGMKGKGDRAGAAGD